MSLELVHGIPVIESPRDMGRAFGQGGGIMRGGFDDDSYTPDMRAAPAEMPTFDEAEQRERIKQQWADESSLIHQYLRSPMQTLDQGEQGFCWAYSTVSAIMLMRMRDGLPYVRLSAHGLACRIMNFQDRGAWSGLSAKWAADIGVPSVEQWPERSMDRRWNTPEMWEEAKRRFAIKGMWYDMARREWDQTLTSRQINTQPLLNNPVAADFVEISHAMCIVGLGLHPDGDIMRCVLNSWRNWGNRGLGWLRGSWANPRSAVAMFQPTMNV